MPLLIQAVVLGHILCVWLMTTARRRKGWLCHRVLQAYWGPAKKGLAGT